MLVFQEPISEFQGTRAIYSKLLLIVIQKFLKFPSITDNGLNVCIYNYTDVYYVPLHGNNYYVIGTPNSNL